jgi:Uma2 family endonuclease
MGVPELVHRLSEVDRGKKFENYRQITSLLEYLLVSQNEARVELFARQMDGSWVLREAAGLEAKLELPSLQITLDLSEVFAGVEFVPVPIRPKPSGALKSRDDV